MVTNLKILICCFTTEVFALSRSLSPTMVSEYNLKLIDKKLLQKKLKEYIELAGMVSGEE